MKPNFLGVGASKSATSWAHACMEEHPEIFVPPEKEIHFFNYNYEKGFDWYESFFREGIGKKAIGEISGYLITPGVPQRIYDYNPDMRLLFFLRNPIDRAYSHYCMDLRSARVSEDIDQVLSLDSQYVVEGLYYKHINRFLKFFPRENLKIFLYDDLKSDAESFSYAIFSFLGVDPLFKPTLLHKVYFGKKPRPKHQRLFNLLVSTTKFIGQRSRYASKKIEYVRKHNRRYIDLFNQFNKGLPYPMLFREKKRSLAKYYWDDISALSDFLGRDLSAFWLSPFLD